MALDELIFGSEKIENVTIFKFQGSINSFTSQRFLESLKKPIRHGAIILDFEDVNLITSQGILALKELAELSFINKSRVLLLNLSQSVKQAFDMAGIRNLFLVPENEEIAMKIASRPFR
jgi:anti-anti-sigma factor